MEKTNHEEKVLDNECSTNREEHLKSTTDSTDNDDVKVYEPKRKVKKVKYDVDFPKTYDMGNMSKIEERFVNAILSELHSKPYSPNGYTIPYANIAMNVGGQFVKKKKAADGSTYYIPRTGKRLNEAIDEIKNKLVSVSYKKVRTVDENGIPNDYDDIFLFTDRVKVNHKTQEYKVFLSDSILEEEFIDYDSTTGETIIRPEKRVYHLFNNENWGKTKVDKVVAPAYLQYNLTIHNSLSGQYPMRLYRELAGYRNYRNQMYYCYAENFEVGVMKLDTDSLIQNKSGIIRNAYEELKSLQDQFGNPLIPELNMKIERRGGKTYKYIFTFKNFSNDLLPVISVIEKGKFELQFPVSEQNDEEKSQDQDYKDVINVFHSVFSTDVSVNNEFNRRTLSDFLELMDKEVIIEMLSRTSYANGKKTRSFGWTVRALKNLQGAGVVTIEDLERFDQQRWTPEIVKMNDLIEENSDYKMLFKALSNIMPEKISLIVIDDMLDNYISKGMSIPLVTEAIKQTI